MSDGDDDPALRLVSPPPRDLKAQHSHVMSITSSCPLASKGKQRLVTVNRKTLASIRLPRMTALQRLASALSI